MPTRLIINADDFGFSRAVTDGILHCHTHGILTSTTLMTTMPDRDRAIDLAGQTPALGVGIHLSLTQGTPLTPCRRLLSRAHGTFFRSLPKLFWKLQSSAARQQAAAELRAQIQYARARGLAPTHVDSHKHVCHLPPLHRPLIDACRDCGISWVRTAREARVPGTPPMSPPYRVLARCAASLAGKVRAAGLFTTDWFFGLASTGRTDRAMWRALAGAAPGGLGEVMVHPGYIQDVTGADTRLLRERVTELEALCDPAVRAALEGAGIVLTQYGQGHKQP
ncbi:MAG TPA: ChbG/HpnK family deacetylase [Phycisphaerae bacterium]|nr:ChbG/HpnK family deacetylase [Phycisphaerae bacterium]